MRNLVRAWAAAVETVKVHKPQVSAFLLRHGRTTPYKKNWGVRYRRRLQEQRFEHPADKIVLQEYVEAVHLAEERLEWLERAIVEFLPRWSLSPVVDALMALRGVDLVVAVSFTVEIGDIRRFESPRQLMGYLGLVPEERSTAEAVRRALLHLCGSVLHGSAVWARGAKPICRPMRRGHTPAARDRACDSTRRQQWPPRSPVARWFAIATRLG
jgi:transposase